MLSHKVKPLQTGLTKPCATNTRKRKEVMMSDFNINEYIWVKLTSAGFKELERQHRELKAEMPLLPDYTPPEVDSDGYSKFQGWSLMNRFGHMMRPTFDTPFDTNIRFDDKALLSKLEESK